MCLRINGIIESEVTQNTKKVKKIVGVGEGGGKEFLYILNYFQILFLSISNEAQLMYYKSKADKVF